MTVQPNEPHVITLHTGSTVRLPDALAVAVQPTAAASVVIGFPAGFGDAQRAVNRHLPSPS